MAGSTLAFNILTRYEGKGTKSAAQDFENLGKRAGGLGESVKSGLSKVGLATGALAAGAVAFGKKSFDAFKGFDKTIRQVGAVTDQSGKKLDNLSDLALKLGKETSFSAGEAADAMLELAKGGLTAAQIKAGALHETLTLAAAGGLGLGDAATYMSNELNAFQLKAKDAGKVAAALAGGANASTASVQSLGQALGQVGPGAVNAGLSLNDTVGVLAAFDQAGIKGSDAGTALKTMLTRLVPSTDKAKSAMEDLGLKFTDAHGNFKDITQIAQMLQDKLGGLTQKQKTAALATIFGSDATRAASVLMREGAKGIGKYIKATKDRSAAEKLAKTNTSGAAGAVEQLQGAFETLEIIIGKKLAPIALTGVKAITRIVNFVTDHALPAIGNFGKAILNKFIPVDKLKTKFGDAKKAISDFFKGLSGKDIAPKIADENLIGQMILPSPSKSAQFGKQIRDIFSGGIGDGLKNIDWNKLGKRLADAVINAIGFLGKSLGKITKTIIDVLGKIDWITLGKTLGTTALPFAVSFALSLASSLFDPVMWFNIFKGNWKAILGVLATIVTIPVGGEGGTIVGVLAKVFEKIPFLKIMAPLLRGIEKFVTGPLAKGIRSVLKALGRGFLAGFRAVFPSVGKGFSEALSLLPTRLGVLALDLVKKAKAIPSAIGRGILGGFEFVGKAVGRLTGYILKPFARSGTWLVKAGVRILRGLLHGITSIAKTVGRWMLDHVVNPALKPYVHAGKWLVRRGKDLIGGLKDGIVSIARGLKRWEDEHVIGPMLRAFSRAGSWLLTRGKGLVNGLKSGIRAAVHGVGRWLRDHVINPVVHRFTNAGKWLLSEGGHIIRGLLGGIRSAMRGIKGWLRDHVWHPIVSGVKALFGIHSPSTVFEGFGHNMIRGLVKGLIKGNAGAFVRKVFGGVSDSAGKALGFLVNHGQVALEKLSQLGRSAFSKVSGFISGIGGAISHGANVTLGRAMAAAYGWTGSQFDALNKLWTRESGWSATARNPSSGAYGIPQALPASKMGTLANPPFSLPTSQIAWGLSYIRSRYGSPAAAWAHELAAGWYGSGLHGAVFNRPTLIGVGERGPERVDVTPLGGRRGGSGGTTVVLNVSGPVGSQRELEDWLVRSLDSLRRSGRLPRGTVTVAR